MERSPLCIPLKATVIYIPIWPGVWNNVASFVSIVTVISQCVNSLNYSSEINFKLILSLIELQTDSQIFRGVLSQGNCKVLLR